VFRAVDSGVMMHSVTCIVYIYNIYILYVYIYIYIYIYITRLYVQQRAFRAVDSDGSGRIEMHELRHLVGVHLNIDAEVCVLAHVCV